MITDAEKQVIKEYLDEERSRQSIPMVFSHHDYKIDMKAFFHNVANCVNNNTQFALLYYIVKNLDKDNITVFDTIYAKKTTGMSNVTFYGFLKRLESTDLVKVISKRRGSIKYMFNPEILFNHKKVRSRKHYNELMSLYGKF